MQAVPRIENFVGDLCNFYDVPFISDKDDPFTGLWRSDAQLISCLSPLHIEVEEPINLLYGKPKVHVLIKAPPGFEVHQTVKREPRPHFWVMSQDGERYSIYKDVRPCFVDVFAHRLPLFHIKHLVVGQQLLPTGGNMHFERPEIAYLPLPFSSAGENCRQECKNNALRMRKASEERRPERRNKNDEWLLQPLKIVIPSQGEPPRTSHY